MQGAGLRGVAFALLEDVFDVLAGEGLALDGVVNGEGELFRAVDVGERDDFVDVDAGLRLRAVSCWW